MEMNHIRRGAGKPLLLIHGIGGSSRSWQSILDDLAAERDVIAIDLPGCPNLQQHCFLLEQRERRAGMLPCPCRGAWKLRRPSIIKMMETPCSATPLPPTRFS